MKKTLLLLCISLASLWSTAQPWEVVGDTTFGSAYDNYYKHIEMIDDVPYVVFRDINETSLKVKAFINNEWLAPNDSLIEPQFDQFEKYETTVDQNNQLNVIYYNPDQEKMIVKKYDGTSWTVVGTPFGVPNGGNYPQLKTMGADKLVALFAEKDTVLWNGSSMLSLYEFDGTAWSRITYGVSDTTVDNCDMVVTSSDEVFVSYQTVEWELYVEKYDGTSWEVLTGGKSDTSEVTGNHLYLDLNDNLYMSSRNRSSSFNWEFRKWNGTDWDLLPSPNHLYAQNGTVMNTSNHAMAFNPMDSLWYIAFTTNTSQRSYFKRFNGTEWEQVGDSLYADPGYVYYSKMRFNSLGNPFYTTAYSTLMTMDLGLSPANNTAEYAKVVTQVFPNPARDRIVVETEQDARIALYNIQHQMVLTQNVTKGQNIIHVGSLPSGVYTLHLQHENSINTHRIIKK